MHWIRSYAEHPAFISAYQRRIREFLEKKVINEEECVLLFSAHGLPRSFITSGDPYESECQHSFEAIRRAFPKAIARLAYQSKFGRGEWLRPSTNEACEEILSWCGKKKRAVIIPLSFTSDHIETLYEIETLYLPILQRQGLQGDRCPALNLEEYWVDALAEIIISSPSSATVDLIRDIPKRRLHWQ
jgi:ferrochelatase